MFYDNSIGSFKDDSWTGEHVHVVDINTSIVFLRVTFIIFIRYYLFVPLYDRFLFMQTVWMQIWLLIFLLRHEEDIKDTKT